MVVLVVCDPATNRSRAVSSRIIKSPTYSRVAGRGPAAVAVGGAVREVAIEAVGGRDRTRRATRHVRAKVERAVPAPGCLVATPGCAVVERRAGRARGGDRVVGECAARRRRGRRRPVPRLLLQLLLELLLLLRVSPRVGPAADAAREGRGALGRGIVRVRVVVQALARRPREDVRVVVEQVDEERTRVCTDVPRQLVQRTRRRRGTVAARSSSSCSRRGRGGTRVIVWRWRVRDGVYAGVSVGAREHRGFALSPSPRRR